MGISGQSTTAHHVDNYVSHGKTVCHRSLSRAARAEGRGAARPAVPPTDGRRRPVGQARAPGHGPGVSAISSSAVFVSKSRKPRRR